MMRMTRAEARERNRRALLDAALEVVSRDGPRARLEEIADLAGLTTGAVYSLFGSKGGLVTALVSDTLQSEYAGLEAALPAEGDLLDAVDALARHLRRAWDAPKARAGFPLQVALFEMALHDRALGARLAESVRAEEDRLVELLGGRTHDGRTVTADQARRLSTALRALLTGLGQGVALGLAPDADEQYFADAARALAPALVADEAG